MRSGQLRHQIIVQQSTQTQSASGATINAWAEFATIRASIVPLNGSEFYAAQQVNAQNNLKFKIRYLPGITTKMRILYGVRVFEIRAINNYNELNKEMVLMVQEDV